MRADGPQNTQSLLEKSNDIASIPNYSPTMSVTMDLTVIGNTFVCAVQEIPGAEITVQDNTWTSGGFGLKNYEMASAIDSFYVYQP